MQQRLTGGIIRTTPAGAPPSSQQVILIAILCIVSLVCGTTVDRLGGDACVRRE